MEFTENKKTSHCEVTDDLLLSTLSGLLEVDLDEMRKTLCGRVVAAGGDVVDKKHNLEEAKYGRDAFAKVGQENGARVLLMLSKLSMLLVVVVVGCHGGDGNVVFVVVSPANRARNASMCVICINYRFVLLKKYI